VRHEDFALLEESVRIANPLPDTNDLTGSEAAARVLLMVRQQTIATESPPQTHPQPVRRGWLRPALAFTAAVVVVLATVGILALVRSEPAGVVEEPDLVTTTSLPEITSDDIVYEVRPVAPTEQQPSLAPSLNAVSDLAFAPDGSLWAATSGGVVRWEIASETPTIFTEVDGLLGSPDGIDVAPDGTVWVTAGDWVARYDGTWTSFTDFGGVEYVRIPSGAVVALPEGEAWFWADMTPNAGLLHFDGATWSTVVAPADWLVVDDLWGGTAFSLDDGPAGKLWVGSDNGVLTFDGESWTHYTRANSTLPSDMAPWIAVAPDGTVWVGTAAFPGDEVRAAIEVAGLAAFDGSAWATYTTADGLPADEAKPAVGPDGTVWAMADGGIARLDGAGWTGFAARGHGYGSTVGPDGTLWQPTPTGISGFDEGTSINLAVSPDVAPHGVPDLTLVAAAQPVTTATPIGNITWYRFTAPIGQGLGDIVSTPFGLVALDRDVLHWSQDLVHWSGTALPLEARQLIADESRVIAQAYAALWLRWDGDSWVADEILELAGRIDQIVIGDRGTVTVSELDMFHAEDGRNFTRVEDSPQPPQLAEEWTDWENLTGCTSDSIATMATAELGPLLATDSGFAALTPAHPANWNNRPLCEPVVWASGDGGFWELLTVETPFGSRSVVTDIASHNGRHIGVGADYGVDAIWLSDDAITWTQVEPPDGLTDPTAVAGSDRGWLLLEDQGTGWVSPDGVTWTRVPGGMPGTRTSWTPPTVSMGHGTIAVSGTEEIVFGVFEE
jgi:hypothetical protein